MGGSTSAARAHTENVVEGSIEDQTRLTLSHIGKVLEAAGCTFDDVVKCTCHLSNIRDFEWFNSFYAQFFKGVRPASTTVQSVLDRLSIMAVPAQVKRIGSEPLVGEGHAKKHE